MKILKKIFVVLLVAVMLVPTFGINSLAASSNAFKGTRSLTFTADTSDVENFIDGGRTVLDLIIRASAPEWADITLSANGRNLELAIVFEFGSYDDYCSKTSELLTYTASVLYSKDDGLLVIESHEPFELLGFIESSPAMQGSLSERTLPEIFRLSKNILVIGEEEYSFEGNVNIVSEDREIFIYEYVNIDTQADDNGEYDRTITLYPENKDEKSIKKLKKNLKKVGKIDTDKNDEYLITVKFSASNDRELIDKTMKCLSVAVTIRENQIVISEDKIGVTRDEYFDIDALISDYGRFEYKYKYPSHYENISVNEENALLQDDMIYSDSQSMITVYYERGFGFDKLDVKTDFSDAWGSVKCTITFVSKSNIAISFHDNIKKTLTRKLPKGASLNIYDKLGNRYYEITYKSWYMDKISEFIGTFLKGDSYMDIDDSFFLIGKSNIEGRFKVKELSKGMMPPKEITATYKFKDKDDFEILSRKFDKTTLDDGSVRFTLVNGSNFEIEYRRINLVKVIFVSVIIVASLSAAVLVAFEPIKELFKKIKKKEPKP